MLFPLEAKEVRSVIREPKVLYNSLTVYESTFIDELIDSKYTVLSDVWGCSIPSKIGLDKERKEMEVLDIEKEGIEKNKKKRVITLRDVALDKGREIGSKKELLSLLKTTPECFMTVSFMSPLYLEQKEENSTLVSPVPPHPHIGQEGQNFTKGSFLYLKLDEVEEREILLWKSLLCNLEEFWE